MSKLGLNYRPRQFWYYLSIVLVLGNILSCRKDTKVEQTSLPSFVRINISLGGSLPVSWSHRAIREVHIAIQGCETFPEDNQVWVIQPEEANQLIQLQDGNEGCWASITAVHFESSQGTDLFHSVLAYHSQVPPSYGMEFRSNSSGRIIHVFTGLVLRTALERFETLSFYLIPALEDKVRTTDLKDFGNDNRINLLLQSIQNNGVLEGDNHGLRVRFSCDGMRNLEFCDLISLLDYRIRLVPLPYEDYDVDFLMNATGSLSHLSRPTVSHIIGNGIELHLLVPKDVNGDLVQDILIIVRLGMSFRTFEVNLRDIFDF